MRRIGLLLYVVVLALSACSGTSTDKAVEPSGTADSPMSVEADGSPESAPPPGTWEGDSRGKDPLHVKIVISDCVKGEDCADHVVVDENHKSCGGPLTYLGIRDGEWVFERHVSSLKGPCLGAELVRWRIKLQGENLLLTNWWIGKPWWKAVLRPV